MRGRLAPTGLAAVGLLLSWAAGGPAAVAQVPTFEGEEVVVPGRRPQPLPATPAYVTVIPAEELRRMGFLTLGDALRFLAEVQLRAAGSGPGGFVQASIRGSSPQQVRILIDGVPVSATAQLGMNLATVSLEEVERIEVLRGPYSAIYGNALGGVILVRTRADPRTEASAGTGSHATGFANLRVGGRWPGGFFSLAGGVLGTGGERPNSDAARWSGTARLQLGDLPGRSVTFLLHHSAGVSGLPGPTFFPSLTDRLADQRTLAGLTWAEAQDEGEAREFRLWWLGDRLTFTSPGFLSDAAGSAFGASWQQVRRVAGGTLTYGVEGERVAFSSVSTFSSFGGEAPTAAGYVQYDRLVAPRTLVGVGLRYDSHPGYGAQLNPRAGFVHTLSDRARVRGGVGRAFRAPTFSELAFPGCSNPALRPEEAWAADLGIEGALRPGLTGRLNAFYTDARDLIVGGCLPTNVGSALIGGLSAEVVGLLAPGWLVSGNLTWSAGQDRTTGLPLLRLAPWQANLVLRHAPTPEVNLSLLVNLVSPRWDLDTSVFPAARVLLDGYVTVGLRVEQRIGAQILRVGVDNLLDARYETLHGFPGPGRTLFLHLASSF